MAEYVLHLPREESIVLSAPVVRRLIGGGNGDAALLYIALLESRGCGGPEALSARLGWDRTRFAAAMAALERQGLVGRPGGETPSAPETPLREKPEYTRADIAGAMEGRQFGGLVSAVEQRLGKKLTTPDVGILLGLYDDVGLPADVIYLLVNFCAERIAAQYGPGRRPTLRQIEREGYTWARLGLMDQHAASDYIRKYQRGREALPRLMALLRLGDRLPSPTEEKYLLSWNDMGFEDAVIELAYDRTMVNCKELKWPYINKILTTWHQNGLHTLQQVKEGDRPAPRRGKAPAQDENTAVRENLARMERYRDEMRKKREKEGS